MKENIYYNYQRIDGYPCNLIIIVGGRGIGKTFGAVKKAVKKFVLEDKPFIYVVETLEMVKELSRNKGDKFFTAILDYFTENKNENKTNKLIYEFLTSSKNEVAQDEFQNDFKNSIKAGSITINDKHAGYILALNDFANLKRNNFPQNLGYIIIDEFIPEKNDIRTLDNPRKLVSIIESILRTRETKIYLLANSVRRSDPILTAFGLSDAEPNKIHKIKDEFGLLGVCEFIDNNFYSAYEKKHSASLSGRIAKFLKQDNLNKNEFNDDAPKELLIKEAPKHTKLIYRILGSETPIRLCYNSKDGYYYILEDYGTSEKLACLDIKYIGPNVRYVPRWRDTLINLFETNKLKFENNHVFNLFKTYTKII